MADVTLAAIGLILLVVTMIFRIIMVGISLRKFAKMFENKKEFREGISLFKYLEIPGLENFVKQEIFFTILPYTALGLVIIVSPVSDVKNRSNPHAFPRDSPSFFAQSNDPHGRTVLYRPN